MKENKRVAAKVNFATLVKGDPVLFKKTLTGEVGLAWVQAGAMSCGPVQV